MGRVTALSYALGARRHTAGTTEDDFPTPRWVTRALLHEVLATERLRNATCLEPACRKGEMAEVLRHYFKRVRSSDLHPFGYGKVADFLANSYRAKSVDWVVSNFPFSRMEEMIIEALVVARVGVAALARTQFLEGVGRYERLFRRYPPTLVAPFAERATLLAGRLDPTVTTATSYSWFIWANDLCWLSPKMDWHNCPRLRQIAPCRGRLEMKLIDYPEAS
jgi:hypothetical protein